jgi:hypothetical protein
MMMMMNVNMNRMMMTMMNRMMIHVGVVSEYVEPRRDKIDFWYRGIHYSGHGHG